MTASAVHCSLLFFFFTNKSLYTVYFFLHDLTFFSWLCLCGCWYGWLPGQEVMSETKHWVLQSVGLWEHWKEACQQHFEFKMVLTLLGEKKMMCLCWMDVLVYSLGGLKHTLISVKHTLATLFCCCQALVCKDMSCTELLLVALGSYWRIKQFTDLLCLFLKTHYAQNIFFLFPVRAPIVRASITRAVLLTGQVVVFFIFIFLEYLYRLCSYKVLVLW